MGRSWLPRSPRKEAHSGAGADALRGREELEGAVAESRARRGGWEAGR